MSFTYQDVRKNVEIMLGMYDGTNDTASGTDKTRIWYYTDDAVRYFRDMHKNYYRSDISYKPDTATSRPTETITIDGSDDYKLTITTSNVDWQDLVGATLSKSESSSTKLNVVREVISTSTGEVKLQYPNEFSDGTATVYVRSVRPSARFTFEFPSEVKGKVLINTSSEMPMMYMSPEAFFGSQDLKYNFYTYPRYYTWVNDVIILDSWWSLDPSYYVHINGFRAPALYSATTGESASVDVPDGFQREIERFAEGSFRIAEGNVQYGQLILNESKSNIRKRKRWGGAG